MALVLRGGDVLSGDENLVGGLNDSCDTLNVCGIDKLICTQSETGMNLAAIEAEVPGIYPLFFCGAPDNEPTCIPHRDEEYKWVHYRVRRKRRAGKYRELLPRLLLSSYRFLIGYKSTCRYRKR